MVDHEFHDTLTLDEAQAFIVALAKHPSTRANRYHPSADRLTPSHALARWPASLAKIL
jgi:hypothetical protein